MPVSDRLRYDNPAYRAWRRYFQVIHRQGQAVCVRCGLPIHPSHPMDLGHVDGDPTRIAGPEHRHAAHCPAGGNRATGRHRVERERQRTERLW